MGIFQRNRQQRCYSRRIAVNSFDFIECVIEEMPFPIQRIQSDRGREVFAVSVHEKFQEYKINFVQINPHPRTLMAKLSVLRRRTNVGSYSVINNTLS